MDFAAQLSQVALAYPVLLFSLCFHEWGHAMSAKLLGDRTAEAEGRLTMNPIAHIDPIGTVLFPLIAMFNPMGIGAYLFGWAKPVPVNMLYLRKMSDIVWVSLAGPACNLVLLILTVIIMKIALVTGTDLFQSKAGEVFLTIGMNMIGINLILMWFNLLPIVPLDGSKVLLAYIPGHSRTMPFWQAYEQNGFLILLVLMFTGALSWILRYPMGISLNLIQSFLFPGVF